MVVKRKAGRPPKPPGEVAAVHVDVRLTRELRDRLRIAAARRDLSMGEWLREAALARLEAEERDA